MEQSLVNRKTFCIITGASRGLGRVIAERLAAKLSAESVVLLLARNSQQLEDVASCIRSSNPSIIVFWRKFDQGNWADCTVGLLQDVLHEFKLNVDNYTQAIIVHNAGVIGDVTKFISNMTDAKMVEETMNVNVTGMILLNASFLTVFPAELVPIRVVINISSLAAIQPFPSMSLYSASKAARYMFLQTLAKEDKNVRVLNYAPGPLDTDMQVSCRNCADLKLQQTFIEMHKKGQLVKCEDTVDKLLRILDDNKFQSGQHIDFYDEV